MIHRCSYLEEEHDFGLYEVVLAYYGKGRGWQRAVIIGRYYEPGEDIACELLLEWESWRLRFLLLVRGEPGQNARFKQKSIYVRRPTGDEYAI